MAGNRRFYIKKKKCPALKSGYKWVNFAWPILDYAKIVATAEREGMKPNDFIWRHLEETLLNGDDGK